MKDIFNDLEFEKFLSDGGGVRDLDEPQGQLIYNLWKAGIKTCYNCCAGHIGKFLEDGHTGPNAFNGFFVYRPGVLFYDPRNAERLTAKLIETTERNKFAKLKREENFCFELEMDDIAQVFEKRENGYARLQIPIQLAQERYAQFLQIWEDLTGWSRGLKH
jgi:hypothetical protein